MLLAVEGGGFFSSSASGYSKGLTLLFLGQRNEEKPMRVTPWNQYQLVDQGTNPDLQLASTKNGAVRGCASFVCFGHTAAGLESPSPLKVGPIQQQEVSPEPIVFYESKSETDSADLVVDDDDDRGRKISLKSSLKKPLNDIQPSTTCGGGVEPEESSEKHKTIDSQMERRKVQWTDTSGGELYQVREFEMSDDDSEFDPGNERTCSCTIM
ncbi:uncharacterized protein LOC111373053 [Olea europaea var. sylvestris]|uniref:uncharacterized protein LOC111373053 n=1 Tax=Olea europaea var. sylvestris TaxID=158386 RepID=UPI000C1D435D|nr:uncharacterized protein LOC111373053 [Olea europaea var. sylvestris]